MPVNTTLPARRPASRRASMRVPLVEEGAGGPPQGVGLAADLGEE